MVSLTSLPVFLTSLGVGLQIGLERQRRPETLAGLRTFALASVAGTACGLIAQQTGSAWLLLAFLLVLAITMVGAELRRSGCGCAFAARPA